MWEMCGALFTENWSNRSQATSHHEKSTNQNTHATRREFFMKINYTFWECTIAQASTNGVRSTHLLELMETIIHWRTVLKKALALPATLRKKHSHHKTTSSVQRECEYGEYGFICTCVRRRYTRGPWCLFNSFSLTLALASPCCLLPDKNVPLIVRGRCDTYADYYLHTIGYYCYCYHKIILNQNMIFIHTRA